MKKLLILAITLCSSLFTVDAADKKDLVDYVNPLVGSQSKISLSTGNTYPAIAMPWGMNFWMPQTGKMGDGWAYTYDADKIRGFKQTHQPSPWINDYGQPFSVAEQFTGVPGVMVSIEDTIRGFKMIMDGETDDIPEQAFLNVGTIEDVMEKAKRLAEQAN